MSRLLSDILGAAEKKGIFPRLPEQDLDAKNQWMQKSPDAQDFVDKHEVEHHEDLNGNGDDVFKASNVKTYARNIHHHGYDHDESSAVHEAFSEYLETLSEEEVQELDTLLEEASEEEVDEFLTELSKKTLGSYVMKTAQRLHNLGGKVNKAIAMRDKATDLASGMRDSLQGKDREKHYNTVAGAADIVVGAANRSYNRLEDKRFIKSQGILRAIKRLTKESEEVNELSKKTLKSYVGIAKDDLGDKEEQMTGKRSSFKNQKSMFKGFGPLEKRVKGIERAGAKLKESQEVKKNLIPTWKN